MARETASGTKAEERKAEWSAAAATSGHRAGNDQGHVNEAFELIPTEAAAAQVDTEEGELKSGRSASNSRATDLSSTSISLNDDDEDCDCNQEEQTTVSTDIVRQANGAHLRLETSPDGKAAQQPSQMELNLAIADANLEGSGGSGKNLSGLMERQQQSDSNSSSSSDILSRTQKTAAGNARTGAEFVISWNNLDHVVESKWYKLSSQRKPILNKLSGSFRSGQLSAVLGPSGAGKSTLINCLLGKRERGTSGQTRVTFADREYERERRKRRPLKIVTIPQEDHLLETLTVTETFMFASKIKNAQLTYEDEIGGSSADAAANNGKKSSRKRIDHFANVQRVIQQLNLVSCATQRCANLSGGQYKRVSIGQELLSRPDLMILDEPTSGLDSVTCFQTIAALRELVDTSPYPMAIVCTIHQPDLEVFNLFHKAYVLASGGRAIYEGPTSSIFDTVQMGADLVESRRNKLSLAGNFVVKHQQQQQLQQWASLREQLARADRDRCINPARLIVEVAANEFGFELTSAMNELQLARRNCGDLDAESPDLPGRQDGSNFRCDSTTTRIYISHGGGAASPWSRSHSHSSCSSIITAAIKDIGALDNQTARPPSPPSFDYLANDPRVSRRPELDALLNLEAANMNQRRSTRVYLRHLYLHCHRSWITIVRDPMLCALQLVLHVFVPLMISYAFSESGKSGDACPRVGPLDVIDEAYSSGNILDDLNRELRNVFENLGYMFFQIYVIIFAAVCVTSLTYPLVMHVLLKEYRNGWYSMSSYFLGRTIADLPVPTINVALAIAISYHLTGQPVSPYHWRFATVAALTVLATLVAQTQGLMFGALLMNLPQSAVFVAPASTAPLVVVSGFLIRIASLPLPLQLLSQLSYFTHLLNGFVIARYGFNRCPCDESQFSVHVDREIPQQARIVLNMWVDTFAHEYPQNASSSVDMVGKLVDTVTRAKTFNYKLETCEQVKPFTMLDFALEDTDLVTCFIALGLMLVAFRWMTYLVLRWKIGSCI